MLDCPGGLERNGLTSPEIGRDIARRDGLAPGWRDELRKGEPTWPKAEAAAESEASFWRPAKNAPNRDGEAVDGDPTLELDSLGVPSPESAWRWSSSLVREKRRIFSCGVNNSCRLFGTRSSSNAKFSSSQSSLIARGGWAPTLAEIILGCRENRSECIILLPIGSSVVAGGEDAKLPLPFKWSSPKAELCRLRNAEESIGRMGEEDGGDMSSPNREGTDAANGPFLAMCDTPWLSKEAGRGASSTLRPFCIGDIGNRPSFCGEP
jgi:hypothetical protein